MTFWWRHSGYDVTDMMTSQIGDVIKADNPRIQVQACAEYQLAIFEPNRYQ